MQIQRPLLKLALIASAIISVPSMLVAKTGKKVTVGWIETVNINGVALKAKIDTGADNSSLNVKKSTVYRKNGSRYIRFNVTNKMGHSIVVDQPIIKYIRIKKKTRNGTQQRPVIMLRICLAGITRKIMVNLVDRSRYKYELLIGRSYLVNHFIVDPSLKFIANNSCVTSKK